MSIARLPHYAGRHWAITADPQGKPDTVHHFSEAEIRDGWVAMDPETRVAVEPSHPAVKRWIKQGKPKLSIYSWFLNLFR
jgi:hypothetical protein